MLTNYPESALCSGPRGKTVRSVMPPHAFLLGLLVAFLLLFTASGLAQTGKELYGADVYWNATPSDVNNLLKKMKSQTDANFQMEIRTLGQISENPEQNPVLFRSGHYHFSYTPQEREKLRKYLLNGGMIIFNTGLGSKPFYDSVVEELKKYSLSNRFKSSRRITPSFIPTTISTVSNTPKRLAPPVFVATSHGLTASR